MRALPRERSRRNSRASPPSASLPTADIFYQRSLISTCFTGEKFTTGQERFAPWDTGSPIRRWKSRGAVRAVNNVLGSLRLEKHPAKTFTLGPSPRARIENGFDFLGYGFTPSETTDSKATILERAARLYEQERERPERISAREMYVRRWLGWVKAGLPEQARRRSRQMYHRMPVGAPC